jgi:exodeoxyribonuclease VII large subunit
MADYFQFFGQVNKRRGGREPSSGQSAVGQPLSVTQLTSLIDRALRDGLPASVLVRGEVSNFKHHQGSGHLYFTLKDREACIDCVMFRGEAARLRFVPRDGMEMAASGRVAVYGQRGKYQLYVTRLEPLGQGALELAFRQLCARLEAEGLFDKSRKKPLPRYPGRIALVTSRQTAALQDLLKVLRRYPWLRVMVYHVPVQGDGSAEKIAEAIADLNRRALDLGGIDVIITGRGGGSLEDLWEFNEEIVARTIAASAIPVVTGIGHEIDVSIADLVADYHAHTPTEAAQVVTHHWKAARDAVEQAGIRLRREMRRNVDESRQRLAGIARHEFFRRPMDRVNQARQMLDELHRAVSGAMAVVVSRYRDRLARLLGELRERHPRHRLVLERQRLASIGQRLAQAMRTQQQRRRGAIDALAGRLVALGPEQVLRRGYTITMLKKGGQIVRSHSDVAPGDVLVTRFADGDVQSTVRDTRQLRLFE